MERLGVDSKLSDWDACKELPTIENRPLLVLPVPLTRLYVQLSPASGSDVENLVKS